MKRKFLEGHHLYNFKDKGRCVKNYVMQYLRRTNRMFIYEGLPDTIPSEYFETYLQYYGFAGVTEVNGSLYAFWGGLGGEPDAYYQPTLLTIANPYLNFDKTCRIGVDCVLVRNDIFMQGLLPILNRYCTALVENDISMNMVSKNMRQVVMITAPTDTLRKAAQKVVDDIEAGETSVAGDSKFLEGIKVFPMQTAHGNSITDLIEYHQYLKGGLFNEIGLNANYNMKREKLNDGETALNHDSLLPLIDEMLQERTLGVQRINDMFGTNISVRLSDTWQHVRDFSDSERLEGGDDDAESIVQDTE